MDVEEQEGSLFDLKKLKKLGGYNAGNLLAVDPDLYSKFMKHLSRKVKRDDVTKNMVFLTGLSPYTPEPINLFLRGESSTGKTYNSVEVLRYFPQDEVWYLGGLSRKALVHLHSQLVDKNGEEINFKDKPEKPRKSDYQDNQGFSQAIKEYKENTETWRKRLENSYNLIDLTGKILLFLEAPDFETFNMLRPILSHDKLEISYQFVDKTAKGQLKTRRVVIRGWPATIFCNTQERYVQDLATRGFTVTPETNPEKIQDANILTGTRAAFPWQYEKDFDFTQLESYIRFLKNNLGDFNVLVPYGKEFAESFPHRFSRSMRDCKHVLNLIKISALFHFAQRPILAPGTEEETHQYVMAIKQDYDFVMALWTEIREETETSAPGHIMKFFNEVVKQLPQKTATIYIEHLVNEWNSKFEDKRSSDVIRKWVDFLAQIGYVSKSPDKLDKRRNVITVIKEEKSGNYTQNSFSEIFGLDSFKAWLNEAKQLLRKSEIHIRENFVSDNDVSIGEIFEKYFLHKTCDFRNIVLGGSKASLSKRAQEKTDFRKSVQFLDFNVNDVLKLERLTTNIQDKCVVCGFEGRMDWQATLHDDSWGLLCGRCGDKLAKKRGEVE